VQSVPIFVAFGLRRRRLHRLHSGQGRDAEHRAASTSATAMLRIPAATNPTARRREVREPIMVVTGDSHCPGTDHDGQLLLALTQRDEQAFDALDRV
jgi:hypothetical protein